jgi:hypothetical protein
MHGQGYDNGANMKGKIIAFKGRAFFVPCATHGLKLMVNDAVNVSNGMTDFLGTVQAIYILINIMLDNNKKKYPSPYAIQDGKQDVSRKSFSI